MSPRELPDMHPPSREYCEPLENEPERFFGLLHPAGSVFQMAVMGAKTQKSSLWEGFAGGSKSIVLGWFNHSKPAVVLIKKIDADPSISPAGIYISLNPANPALLSRANQHLRAGIPGTKDEEVECLRHFLIDIDPPRPSGTNSSDEEHGLALKMAEEIKNALKDEGWPEPILISSGNGTGLVYRTPDLANNQVNRDLLKSCLTALAHRFNTEGAKVDIGVSNPAHLVRVPGTVNRKGDPAPDRPQRLARIVAAPRSFTPVSLERIKGLAATCSEGMEANPVGNPESSQASSSRLDVRAYCEKYNVPLKGTKRHGNSTLFILEKCLFDSSHQGGGGCDWPFGFRNSLL